MHSIATAAGTRTGGELIADALSAGGVRHAFGIAGVHNLPLYDALGRQGSISTIVTRHEQGAAFMADGYARVSGEPGVALVTTGPGLTNTVTPLAGAWADSVPLLVIGTAGPLPLLGRQKGFLHEFKDQHGVMDAAAGSRLVDRTGELEQATLDALAQIQSGRPRPMSLEVPIDVLAASAVAPPATRRMPRAPEAPPAADITRAAVLLRDAKYPLLFAGGGAARLADATLVQRLAAVLRAPVLTSIGGKGALPDTDLWSAGCTWRNSSAPSHSYPEVWTRADAGLVIGSRLTSMSTRDWTLKLPERLAHLDIDPSEPGKNYPVELSLVGDAGAGIELLLEEIARLGGTGASRWDPAEIRAARDADDEAGTRQCAEAMELMQVLGDALGDDGILACDQAIACYWAVRHFRVTGQRRFLYPAGSATLGFGVPVGIGAQVAAPGVPVCVLVGDGGFLFTGTELATAVQYELPIAIVICNDNAYGMIKLAQERLYEGRVVDTELRNPDFVAYGRAFGAHAEHIAGPAELAAALPAAWSRKGPSVFVLDIALSPPYH
jgi:thiamine pyrophosphate-dependent acetolactate synthase large subunit-like protein